MQWLGNLFFAKTDAIIVEHGVSQCLTRGTQAEKTV